MNTKTAATHHHPRSLSRRRRTTTTITVSTKRTTTMEETSTIRKDTPQLLTVLKEMKDGLDVVRTKVQALTAKVKAGTYPTADGMSYLEAKHLLLLNYCQSLVYYLLRKARGLSIENHPVVLSLVEMRLFLEKIRPIDKKLEYQVQKLLKDANNAARVDNLKEEPGANKKTEDSLKYRPNVDMLVSRTDETEENADGVYRPPKFAPTTMGDDIDKMSKEERNALRREKQTQRQTSHGYIKDLMDEIQGKPVEVRDTIGDDSRELMKYRQQWEKRAQQEEDLFTRVSLSKIERRREKLLKRSRGGLGGLTDDFFDEIGALPFGGVSSVQNTGFHGGSGAKGKFKKRKRQH